MSYKSGGGTIVNDGLISYWDAGNPESYSGVDWIDLINNIHLTNNGSVVFNNEGYMTFDTTAWFESFEQGVHIPLNTTVSYTLWYRRNGSGNGSPRMVETTPDGATSSAQSNGLFIDLDGSLRAWLDDGDTTGNRFMSLDDATTWTDTDWHYMVMTFDTPSGILYMDTNVVDTATGATTNMDDINNIFIGAIGPTGYADQTQHSFDGDIAICQIYNKALTPTEILQNYNAIKHRFQ